MDYERLMPVRLGRERSHHKKIQHLLMLGFIIGMIN